MRIVTASVTRLTRKWPSHSSTRVWRASAHVGLSVLARYADTGSRCELRWNQRCQSADSTPSPVRGMADAATGAAQGAQAYRLVTSILARRRHANQLLLIELRVAFASRHRDRTVPSGVTRKMVNMPLRPLAPVRTQRMRRRVRVITGKGLNPRT
jgi:hypothetical protein